MINTKLKKESKKYNEWKQEYRDIIILFNKLKEDNKENRKKYFKITFLDKDNKKISILNKIIFTFFKEIKSNEDIPIYIQSGITRIPINKVVHIEATDPPKIFEKTSF